MRKSGCSTPDCANDHAPSQRLCVPCHNAYMRSWRINHRPSDEQRIRGNARTYLHVYVSRGKVDKLPCAVCGEFPVHGHHHRGYDDPLDVVWLCPDHHREEHRKLACKGAS
jgi:hypothetical protein